ncbi:hypothetical protein SOVF_032410 [Spinacia oleracea]|nr:hypothetical protein SOVF_032410 [Spinacia oleracea]
MCESCSSSSSSSSSDDSEVCKWMTDIGTVKANDDDVTKKCSCCDGVLIKINPISKVSSSEFVIKERELLGGCFSDQNVQIGSDQSDDHHQPKFGYQILDDGAEEDEDEEDDNVAFQPEKEPLLDNNNTTNEKDGESEEIISVTTQNLCPDMLAQHLEFYIDHDDYRLIPVEFLNDDSIKLLESKIEEDKKEASSGFSREFELVFEGNEFDLPGCEVTTSKDLPSIQEEEETEVENLQTHKDEEKMVVFEGTEFLAAGCETESLQNPKDDEQMDKFELVFEGNELVSGFELENILELPKDEEKVDKFELVFEGNELVADSVCENSEISKGEDSENFELVFEGDELVAGFESENIQLPKEEEKIDKFELVFEGGNVLVADSVCENSEISKGEDSENFEQIFEGDEQLVSECDIINENSPKEEEETAIEKLQVREDEEEQEDSLILQPLQEQGKDRELDISATVESPPTSSVYEEDNSSNWKTDETDTDEKGQNPTEKLLFQEYEANLASLMRSYETETEENQNSTDELLTVVDESSTPCKQENHTSTDNVVSNDAEISERSLNSNVNMCNNEVEEERVSDAPTSSEHDAEISERSLNSNEVEEDRVFDAPTSSETLHNKLLLLERRESATEESLDGMSEQGSAGETMEKLKLDLLSERKTLRTLYKELEEERNASAIAANQTMAMITRIQEEKATMQMEALQYQRMMEEQSEYDQEALQMMNELVVKREKEKVELEKELEVYRKKVMEYEERERLRIMCRRRSRNSSASCSYGEESDEQSIDLNHEVKEQEEDVCVGVSPKSQAENGHLDTPTDAVVCLQDSLSGFEDERQAILEQLKVLEEKLFTLAEEEEEHYENMKPFEQFYEENGKDFDSNNGVDSNGFIHHHHNQDRRNDSMPKKLLLPLFDAADQLSDSPNGELNGNEEDEFHLTKFELEKKRFAVEEEVDHVYERLQALEADREFLKHCIGSLRKGDKGLDLLQEILQHLRDLKNVEVQAMKNTDQNTDQCASV